MLAKYDKFIRFLINGGFIGLISWLIQTFIYWVLLFFPVVSYKMSLSIYLSFIVVIFINFYTLKKYVFKATGLFNRFLVATTFVIIVIGFLSEIIFNILSTWFPNTAQFLSYPVAAIMISPVSFFIKDKFVFE